MTSNNKYNLIISPIEKIRSKNNVNWMNILRLAFKLDAASAKKIMKKIKPVSTSFVALNKDI